MIEVIGAMIGLVIISVCFGANFYLLCQWLVYPILRRRRFQVCKPYLLIGWVLYVLGSAVVRQIGRAQQSETLTNAGNLVAVIGWG